MADHGISTRREADKLIAAGRVFVNGRKAVIGERVSEHDEVTLKDRKDRTYVYIAYHKPRGVISHSPQQDEEEIPRDVVLRDQNFTVFPIGRLDKDSSGLIILTNDGRITDRLLNPKYDHSKTYLVTVDKPVTNHLTKWLRDGVGIEGYKTLPAEVRERGERSFELTLREGKKHQIRRMCAALGFQVVTLERISIENILLGNLKPGAAREITGEELTTFLQTLGL
jgi:23S rRNA pseudouridine2604 synthase